MTHSGPSTLRKFSPFAALFLSAVCCFPAFAQDLKLSDDFGVKSSVKDSLVEFEVGLSPAEPAAGSEVTLSITAKIPPEHYIYSTKPKPGAETKITVAPSRDLQPIDDAFQADHPPKVTIEDDGLGKPQESEKYTGQVTWTCRYRVAENANLATASIQGQVEYQICNTRTCRRPKPFTFDVKLSEAAGVQQAPLATEPAAATELPVQANDKPASAQRIPAYTHVLKRKSGEQVLATWFVTLQPGEAKPGDVVTLSVEADVQPPWHIYAIDQGKTATGEGPFPTAIQVEGAEKLESLDPSFQAQPPHEEPSEGWEGLVERFYEKNVVWTKRFKIPANMALGKVPLSISVEYQVCKKGSCVKGNFAVAGEFVIAAQPAGNNQAIAANAAQNPQVVVEKPVAAKDNQVVAAGNRIDKSGGLMVFLIAAIVAGFAALLTPCVFPMIPITVSFFLKQSEKQHHRPVTMATTYCLGIIGTFTGLGLLLSVLFKPTVLNQLANNGWLNLAIGGMLIFFAMNLLGMFEIRVPAWLLTYSAGQEGRGGFVGVLFMALTFTLTSFTCTFAFAGGLLVAASNGDWLWPILGLLAFSAAFSLPFFFLALFPSFLHRLPKSGGWMNVVKVTMGMIEFGAAFKFFSVADLTWHPAGAWLFDYEFVLAGWMVVSMGMGLYLLGMYRLPHDTPRDHIGVFRWVSAMAFLGLAAYMGVGLLTHEKPNGKLWATIDAVLPPKVLGGVDPIGPYIEHGGLRYALDIQRALDFAVKQNLPLFFDFTGVNCVNCRKMENGPMSRPEIKERLSKFVRIQLFTDVVPRLEDQVESRRLLEQNRNIQENWFGDVTLPAYAVVPPDPEILKDPKKILARLEGADEEKFAPFLDAGLERWEALKSAAANSNRLVGRR